jgi:uncharacterized phage protein gp47/JayE
MAYGVLLAGFLRKPLDVCVSELAAAIHATFGATQDTDDPSGPWAQLIGVLADRESELWDMGEGLYASRDPDQATGDALRGICAITGTVPKDPIYSTVGLTITGTPGTVIGAGFVASVTGSGIRFQTTADVTIASATAWAPSTTYAVGDRRTNGGNIYDVTGETGPSAGSGGPSGTGTSIVDGGVTWKFVIAGTAYADAPALAEETGPLLAPAGTLTTIETPVGGVAAVTNPLDAEPGRNIETDAELRLRRVAELAVAGSATPPSVRAEIQGIEGVTSCTVFENTGDVVDADGVPPHAIEAVVSGGADQDIFEALWRSRSAGIYPHGGVSGTVTDDQGVPHTMRFTRPTSVPVYIVANIRIDSSKYPADGDVQVKAALGAWGVANLAGDVDVVSFQLKRALTVSGIIDCPSLYIGTAPAPTTEATIPVGSRAVGEIDTSRITVNHV